MDRELYKRPPIRAYTKAEMAAQYGMSLEIFKRNIRIAGVKLLPPKGRSILTPKEVEAIYNALGAPEIWNDNEKA